MTRAKLHEIIFEADTKKGKIFDIILLVAILISVFGVILSSVDSIERDYGNILRFSEWIFTILFTIEYIFRIYCIKKPIKYIFSFMGIIDFLSIIPTYLVFLYPPIHVLVDIRAIRLIRVFRVFKLSRYLRGANIMQIALKSSRPKIIVFLLSVVLIVIILGTLMYIVEGQKNGFENIPKSIYWSVVTLTTVGYGDVYPITPIGKFFGSLSAIFGVVLFAIPTGILASGFVEHKEEEVYKCSHCGKSNYI